jgi:hypothetical protein
LTSAFTTWWDDKFWKIFGLGTAPMQAESCYGSGEKVGFVYRNTMGILRIHQIFEWGIRGKSRGSKDGDW